MHLFNPIVEVCLLSRLALDGGLLLHAAGIAVQDQGYVFTGASGTGKSTIAQLFADQGALILSDERVILRQQGALSPSMEHPGSAPDSTRRTLRARSPASTGSHTVSIAIA